jgi:glutathione S-transferase
MKLYHSPTSPYVRKCMVLLHEAGALDRVELVAAKGTPLDASAMPLGQNPLGKIPVLERADGPSLFDSRVITRFLDDTLGAGLYPASRLWEVMTLEALADGITDAALLMTYESRLRPEDKRWDDYTEGQWTKIARSAETVEARWMPMLSGPIDMGQIAFACALAYVDFRHGARDWRAACPSLAAWYAKMAERESMTATIPPEGA